MLGLWKKQWRGQKKVGSQYFEDLPPLTPSMLLKEAIRLFRLRWPQFYYELQAEGLPVTMPTLKGREIKCVDFRLAKAELGLPLDEIARNYIFPAIKHLSSEVPLTAKILELEEGESFDGISMSINVEEVWDCPEDLIIRYSIMVEP